MCRRAGNAGRRNAALAMGAGGGAARRRDLGGSCSSVVLLERVEPMIGRDDRPTLSHPIGRRRRRPWPGAIPPTGGAALRFELYAAGIELAQRVRGADRDPAEQRQRFVADRARRAAAAGLRSRSGLADGRGAARGAAPPAALRRGSRSASTACSCWRPAPAGSGRCSGGRDGAPLAGRWGRAQILVT